MTTWQSHGSADGAPAVHRFTAQSVAPDRRVLRRLPVVGAALLVLGGCAGPAPAPTPPAPTPSASVPSASADPSPSAAGSLDVDIADLGAQSITVEPFADFLVSSGDLVWVSGAEPGIVAYDASMAPVMQIEAGEVWAALEFGHGAVWASEAQPGADATTLLKVDVATGAAQRFPLPAPGIPPESSIGVTDDAVWVIVARETDGGRWSVLGLDPGSGTVIREIDAGEGALAAVRGGFGSVWVTRPTGELGRYDATTGELQATIPLPRSSTFLAIDSDAVWVMNQLGEVARVDPSTDELVATIEASPVGIIGGDIVATADAIWLQASSRLAVEIDPATNEVVQRLMPAQGSGSVAVTADGAVWITAHDEEALYRIPPE